jgi:flagellar biosynthesis protein FliQ
MLNIDNFIHIGQEALVTVVYVSAPILGLGLVAGLAVSIFQAATQINDGALAFIPKILATIAGIAFFGNFMLSKLVSFTIYIFSNISSVGR